MNRRAAESRAQILSLAACFGLPLFFQAAPDYLPLAAVMALSALLMVATVKSRDPFLSTGLVTCHTAVLYANCVAYSVSGDLAMAVVSYPTGIAMAAYLVAVLGMIAPSGRRVGDIDLEYFRYSLPSRRLRVDMGRRTGRLNQNEAALRLQLFVKEGLQFRRLSKFCRLLLMQCWGGLLVFLLFGAKEPLHLLVFMLTSVTLGASASSIARRATLHPTEGLEHDLDEPDDDDLEDDEESRALIAQYLERRRAKAS